MLIDSLRDVCGNDNVGRSLSLTVQISTSLIVHLAPHIVVHIPADHGLVSVALMWILLNLEARHYASVMPIEARSA